MLLCRVLDCIVKLPLHTLFPAGLKLVEVAPVMLADALVLTSPDARLDRGDAGGWADGAGACALVGSRTEPRAGPKSWVRAGMRVVARMWTGLGK